MSGKLACFLALLGWVLVGSSFGQTTVNQIGPWKLGMTRAEVEQFPAFGPYSYNAGQGWVNTHDCIFNEKRVAASLQIQNDALACVQITVHLGTSMDAVRAEMIQAVDAMRAGLGLPVLTREEASGVLSELERKRAAGESVLVSYQPPGISGVGATAYRLSSGQVRITIWTRKNAQSETAQRYLILPLQPPHFVSTASTMPGQPSASLIRNGAALGTAPKPDGTTTLIATSAAKLKANRASVNALLVRALTSGGNAAQSMKLSATAVPAVGTFNVGFNQPVGPDMKRALGEVVRGVQVKYQELPATEVQLGFADKWGGKDGPSAAVACALLLESLIQGFPISESLAVTGDLNADLTVQPVGGVPDKLRGAMDVGCTLVGVPAANEEDLNDLVVEEGIGRFLKAQVFTLGNLDDALVLAHESGRSEAVKAALADFQRLQGELKQGGAVYLAKPETQARIVRIGQALPNHYSAKILLRAAQRRLPARFSLVGSLIRIDEAMTPFGEAVSEMKRGTSARKYLFSRDNPMSQASSRLSALRGRSDERLTPLINAQASLVTAFQRTVGASDKASFQVRLAELIEAQKRIDSEAEKFKEDKAIQDELMRRGGSPENEE